MRCGAATLTVSPRGRAPQKRDRPNGTGRAIARRPGLTSELQRTDLTLTNQDQDSANRGADPERLCDRSALTGSQLIASRRIGNAAALLAHTTGGRSRSGRRHRRQRALPRDRRGAVERVGRVAVGSPTSDGGGVTVLESGVSPDVFFRQGVETRSHTAFAVATQVRRLQVAAAYARAPLVGSSELL
jgi:hypothetical protein